MGCGQCFEMLVISSEDEFISEKSHAPGRRNTGVAAELFLLVGNELFQVIVFMEKDLLSYFFGAV